MKRNGFRYLVLIPALVLAFSASAAAAAESAAPSGAATVSGAVDVGVQGIDVNGSQEKFDEYRDLERGFHINEFRLRAEGTDTPLFLDVEIRDPLEDDEFYRVEAGRHGKYRLQLEFDATPHTFGSGTFLFGGFGTDRLWIADAVQEQLQATEQTRAERGGRNVNADTTGEDAARRAIIEGLLPAAGNVTFQVKREKSSATLEYSISKDFKTWLRVTNENRDGARLTSAGTYERYSQGSGLAHTADQFLALGTALAEPIDYQTLSLAVGTGVYRQQWLADLEYRYTQFRNENEALLWDNPFRLTDASSYAADGLTPANAFERGRFETGQLALPPDSQSSDLTGTAAVDLPLHGRLAASLSYGVITQNEDFLPYTNNSDITVYENNSAIGFDVTDPARLPQNDLNGEVTTWAGTLSLSARPLEPLKANVKYRYYDYDNDSDQITFPGYAAYGESIFRPVKNDRNAAVVNDPFGYTRQNADVVLDLRVARPLSLSLESGWEGWRFDALRLEAMDEYSVGGGLKYRIARGSTFKAAYKYSDRSIDGYLKGRTAENPEATGLINYNWAERTRHQADARLNLTPSDTVSLGLSAKWMDEEYGGETEGGRAVDEFRFGRTDLRTAIGAVDVSYTPSERLVLYGNYARENRKEQIANAAKDDGVKAAAEFGHDDNYAPENYWNAEIEEDVDTVGVGARFDLVPGKLTLDAGYNFSASRMAFATSNPNGVSATTLDNAVAKDWGTVRSRLHEVKADLGYQVSKQLKVGVRYLYEYYDLDDFAWDELESYLAGETVENTSSFIFSDATYDYHSGHVGGVYLAYSF